LLICISLLGLVQSQDGGECYDYDNCGDCTANDKCAWCPVGKITNAQFLGFTSDAETVIKNYCWEGGPFGLKNNTHDKNAAFATGFDISCDESPPRWKQCSIKGVYALLIAAIIIAVVLALIIIAITVICRRCCRR